MDFITLLGYFVLLTIMIDPPGVIAPYLSITKGMTNMARRAVLLQSIGFASVILVACIYLGRSFLAFMGISTFALQIAGGILFFKFGYELMNGQMKIIDEGTSSLVPLGFPIIAGPGSITATIVIASNIHESLVWLLLVVLACMGLLLVVLLAAPVITNVLGDKATTAMVKLMGLLIITIGIQMTLQGLGSWIHSLA